MIKLQLLEDLTMLLRDKSPTQIPLVQGIHGSS